MKLFVAASAFASVTATQDPTPSCTDGNGDTTQLFDVVCDAETATMTVTVDETCRQSDYSFIDFANSFIQGDENVNVVDDIDSNCLVGEYKAATSSNEYVWTLNLNGDCVQPSENSEEGVYVFYWKAGKIST